MPFKNIYTLNPDLRIKMRKIGLLVFTMLLWGTHTSAHDMWLEPDDFHVKKDSALVVRQYVGHDFEAHNESGLLWRMTPLFGIYGDDYKFNVMDNLPDLSSMPNIKPVFNEAIQRDGMLLIAMDHDYIHDSFSRDKFIDHLIHEEYAPEEFAQELGDKQEFTERYSRNFKSLVLSGENRSGLVFQKAIGQKLEIIPLDNPYQLNPGDALKVKILLDGKPLADQLVSAFRADDENNVMIQKVRTDAEGLARFKIAGPGRWLIHLVHIAYLGSADADWESHWSSMTFAID